MYVIPFYMAIKLEGIIDIVPIAIVPGRHVIPDMVPLSTTP